MQYLHSAKFLRVTTLMRVNPLKQYLHNSDHHRYTHWHNGIYTIRVCSCRYHSCCSHDYFLRIHQGLEKKRWLKRQKRNIPRNKLIKIKGGEQGWGRDEEDCRFVSFPNPFSFSSLLYTISISEILSPTRKYPKLMHYLTDMDLRNYNSLTLWTGEVMAASAAYVIPLKTMSNS